MPELARYEGLTADELRARLGLPSVELLERVPSTLDVAHALAGAGAASGTLVLAEEQTAGRGRGGRRWVSAPGAGIWLTLIERPREPLAAAVLSLRLGIRAAAVLDRYASTPVALKWPNDLHLAGGKLGGILIETRWRQERPDWTVIGIGINVRPPVGITGAAALDRGSSRAEVLAELVPVLRAAVAVPGGLSAAELCAFEARDLGRGRACREPVPGTVQGIGPDGSLLVRTNTQLIACNSGSLVLEGEGNT